MVKAARTSEGASDVDIAAQSHPQWKQWKKSLSTVEQTWLRIWRGGAVKTGTRRWWRPDSPLQMTQCRCGALRGSAKHLFEECPLLANPSGHRRVYGSAPGLLSKPAANYQQVRLDHGWTPPGACDPSPHANCIVPHGF